MAFFRYCDTFYSGFKTKKGYNGEKTTKEYLVKLIEENVENRALIVEMFDVNEHTLLHPFYDFDLKRENYSSLSDEEFEAWITLFLHLMFILTI